MIKDDNDRVCRVTIGQTIKVPLNTFNLQTLPQVVFVSKTTMEEIDEVKIITGL